MTTDIDYERLYEEVLPSVVSVYAARDGSGSPRGSGSGFVYDAAGYVVTNHHVVAGTDRPELRFSRDDRRVGRVVGADAYTDLAVVEVEDLPEYAAPLRVAKDHPAPGRPVAALGNPLGLDGSISTGIVSGTNRSMAAEGRFAMPAVVQTDAPINPGNSGGPLVTATADGPERYEVVGVNRAKQGDNIGFAVSPTIVNRVVPELIETGRYRHPYLRIRTLDVTPTVAEANGLDDPRGVLIVDAHPDIQDRLRPSTRTRRARGREVPTGGDVLLGIDGRDLRSHEELMRYLLTETRPGETVELTVLRGGRERSVRVPLEERPPATGDEESMTRIPVR